MPWSQVEELSSSDDSGCYRFLGHDVSYTDLIGKVTFLHLGMNLESRCIKMNRAYFFREIIQSFDCGVNPLTLLSIDIEAMCSGQLIPDTTLSFSSARAGANPSLN